jgi:hypothetical protein
MKLSPFLKSCTLWSLSLWALSLNVGYLPLSVAAKPTAVTVAVALPDQEATALMYTLSEGPKTEVQAALRKILTAQDRRFTAVFIELMRANEIGIASGRSQMPALQELSGKSFGNDFDSYNTWVEWYGGTKLTPPPGFTTWKGKLLSKLDPGFASFLQDQYPSHIRTEEIQWGGVLVDGIPALDQAKMLPAAKATYLKPGEPVFGISINGDARAYPLRILDWHEMANDVIGGVPVSLAYCTLCGAGIAYDGRFDGTTHTFGSSGFLFRSNKLMYDRQTRTLWNQLTGEPVLGKLVNSKTKLRLLPIVLTSWQAWKEQHPNTMVLDLNTGFDRPYELGAAYGNYFASKDLMFPVWQRSQRLQSKDRVYALYLDQTPKAYPIGLLAQKKVVNDSVGKTSVVLVATRNSVTVKGESLQSGSVRYSAGAEVRSYDRGAVSFRPGPKPNTLLDEAGHSWQVTEEALVGPQGKRAPRINGHLAYWFGWYTFYPKTLVYGSK